MTSHPLDPKRRDAPPDPSPRVDRIAVVAVLAAAGLTRLIAITQPYVDAWAWRQADVGSIARNFLVNGFNLLYPQIDWGGAGPGYVGTEFPLVPFLAACGYPFLGEQAWIGRAVSTLSFLVCAPFVYLLARDLYNRRSGLFALVFFSFAPLVLVASRSFTSDMTALSLAIVALYLFRRWMEDERSVALFIAATVATALALLVKIPYVIFGLPILVMARERFGWRLWRETRLWFFAAGALGIPALWYGHAYQISLAHFPHHIFGDGMLKPADFATYVEILRRTFGWTRQYGLFSAVTPLVTVLMLGGMFLVPPGKYRWTLHWLLAASLAFLIAAGRGSRFPPYQLSFVVVAAAFAGAALDALLSRLAASGHAWAARSAGMATMIGFGVLAFVLVRAMYYPWATPYADAGAALDRLAPKRTLIVAASRLEPMLFYFSRRKGWAFDDRPGSFVPATPDQAREALGRYLDLGARYFVTTRYTPEFFGNAEFRGWIKTQGRFVADTEDYYIVELDGETRRIDG